MSEPMSAEERAAIRHAVYAGDSTRSPERDVRTLLDEVDRLTEALEQAAKERTQLSGIAEAADRRWLDTLKRAERAEADLAETREKLRHATNCSVLFEDALAALNDDVAQLEADLADEKRRHAGLRAGVEALGAKWGTSMAGARQRANTNEDFREIRHSEDARKQCARELRALLSDTTTGCAHQ